MWLDPYIHVGPATLAAMIASIWYIISSVRNIEAPKPNGSLFLLSLIIISTGLGVVYLILMGHSDLYKVNGVDYTLLTAFSVLFSTPIFFWCVHHGRVRPLMPKPSSEILAILSGLLICVGAHLIGVLGYPLTHIKNDCDYGLGCAGAFWLGGAQGLGMFFATSFIESYLAVGIINMILKLMTLG